MKRVSKGFVKKLPAPQMKPGVVANVMTLAPIRYTVVDAMLPAKRTKPVFI